jgi:hypothetical protein
MKYRGSDNPTGSGRHGLTTARGSLLKRRLLAVLAMVVGVFALAFPALATHPDIDSTATCDGTVTWTATAWVHGDPWRRTTPNDSVEIYRLIGDTATLIATGEFNAGNGFSFSGSLVEANGQLVRLRVVATEGFFEDEAMTILVGIGTFREANVRVPDPCPDQSTTTSIAPTTTVAPTTTAASTTSTEPEVTVSGIIVTLPSNPQVGSTASTLPFTGMSSGSLAVIGGGLIAFGLMLAVMSRRTEDSSASRSWS